MVARSPVGVSSSAGCRIAVDRDRELARRVAGSAHCACAPDSCRLAADIRSSTTSAADRGCSCSCFHCIAECFDGDHKCPPFDLASHFRDTLANSAAAYPSGSLDTFAISVDHRASVAGCRAAVGRSLAAVSIPKV